MLKKEEKQKLRINTDNFENFIVGVIQKQGEPPKQYEYFNEDESYIDDVVTDFEMIEDLAHRMPNYFIPCNWEIVKKHTGSMYETISGLKKSHPNKVFYIVIGMDNANEMEKASKAAKECIRTSVFY